MLDRHRRTIPKHQTHSNQPMSQQELEQHHVFSHMKPDPMPEYHPDYLLDNVTTESLPKQKAILHRDLK